MYAGIRPQRVARLVNLEGFGLAATRPGQAPERYARWLDELHEPPRLRPYRNFQELADRLRQGNKRLTPERADFLARHWGRETEQGEVVLRGDPAHKVVNPVLYRYEEVHACWQKVEAPVLWADAAESETLKRLALSAAEHAERRGAVRHPRHVTAPGAGRTPPHHPPATAARRV